MDEVKQLKTIRDDALLRLHANPDYKLFVALDTLITELEEIIAVISAGPELKVVETTDESSKQDEEGEEETAYEDVDDAFDKISAELDGEAKIDLEDDSEARVSFN